MEGSASFDSAESDVAVRSAGLAVESATSAVSWPAILGGGIAAAAMSVLLLLLGAGLGLATRSPGPDQFDSLTSFTIAAGIWLIVVQWLSSALGGYLTGRLRTKWVRVHTHEVFFRDTAHGLLTWGLASVFSAFIAASAVSSATGVTPRSAATLPLEAAQRPGIASGWTAGVTAMAAPLAQSQAYEVDSLFRGEKQDLTSSDANARAETLRIFAAGVRNGGIPDADRAYLANTVAERTGLSPDDSRKRVDVAINQEKAAEIKEREATDNARKSIATASLFSALSMVIGAFVACAAAAYGGSLRDEHP